MKKLLRYLKLYFLITAQYIKGRLQYRADVFISAIGILFMNGASFLTMMVLFRSIPALEGWSRDQMVFLYAFSLLAVSPTQVIFDHIWGLRHELQSGAFIKYYFKPLNSLFAFIADVVDLKGFAMLAFAVSLLVYSSIRIGFPWDLRSVLVLLLYLLGAGAAFAGLMIISSCTAFWITNSYAVMAFFFRFRDYARWPVSIFDGVIRFAFTTFIPLGFIATFPVQGLIDPDKAGFVPWLTPLVGAAFFTLACLMWRKGTRIWSGTGS